MPVSFRESRTLQNLMRAFAGESQARNRYTFAAAMCEQQNFHVLQAVFTLTANQEKEHAQIFYNHMGNAAGQIITVTGDYPVDRTDDICDLLRQSRDHEFAEHDPVYPDFADAACKEGFPDIAASFEQIAQIEHSHGLRFDRYAEWLQQGKLFVSDVECGWFCLNCGHIHYGMEAPKTCPVCSHDQGFFIRLEMAPYGGPHILTQ